MPLGKFNLDNFKYHLPEERAKLSAILPLILSYREQILDIYYQQYKIAQKYCKYSRLCNNAAIGMAI